MALHLHGLVKKFYFVSDESIAKSSIDMHVKCGAVDYAESAFLRMPNPSLFCWNSMISDYSKLYSVDKAINYVSENA